MLPRRDRMLLFAFAALVFAWMLVQALTGAETGLLYLAPALLLGLLLLGGRYVGEERLLGATGPVEPAVRARKRVVATHTFVRVMERGGRLVASSLAKRPPPSPGLLIAS